jgi:hypothetical protein
VITSIQNGSNDIFAKVTIDQTSTGKFGGVSIHDISEFALVMIESQGIWIIDRTNINNNLAGC